MPLRRAAPAILLLAGLGACTPRPEPHAPSAPVAPVGPMAPFARMTPGEWRMTATSGNTMTDAWRPGPGGHSMRVMTDGQDAGGNPWLEMRVYYWHPGRRQVRMLGLNPYSRGVSEGAVRFEGDAAETISELHQVRGRRAIVQRWTFTGPDVYHDALLEATSGPPSPLAEWDRVRVPARPTPTTPPTSPTRPVAPPDRLKPLERLLDRTWQARDERTGGPIRTGVEWIPYADAVYTRVTVPGDSGDVHVLDAYLYHHTGANVLRCLALSDTGGVYEGDIAVLEGGALQADLTGHEGDRTVRYEVRLDFEPDGVRQRVWSVDGAARTPVLDLHHRADGPG